MGVSDVGVSNILAQFVAPLEPRVKNETRGVFSLAYIIVNPTFTLMLIFADLFADRQQTN